MVCITEAKEIFKKAYGADATHLFSAAGRINVIGEHVDYCGGKVLPAALNLSCKVYARKNGERVIRILLKGIEGVITLELDKLIAIKRLNTAIIKRVWRIYCRKRGLRLRAVIYIIRAFSPARQASHCVFPDDCLFLYSFLRSCDWPRTAQGSASCP